MRGVVFKGPGSWELQDRPDPRPTRSDEVLLEIERVGICGTDLHILSDPPGHPATPGIILGHEYAGRVVEAGPEVANIQVGDRVVVDPNITCGHCELCRRGFTNMCSNMTTLGIFRDGGMARYNVAPARALHPVSDDVSPERAVLAEPLSCIYAGAEKSPPSPGGSVVVLGAGPIGLMYLMLYRLMGAGTVVAVEPRERRRGVARELGADAALDFGSNLEGEIRRILPHGADIVVDAAGTLLDTAVRLARPGGSVVLFGMIQHARQQVEQYDITRKELTVVGSYIQRNHFPKVTRLLRQGSFPIDRIITRCLPLSHAGEALESMRKGEALKIVFDPTR